MSNLLPPSDPSATDGSGTAARILDVAEELFAERGFAGTAIRDIATRVGLNPASLYNHFPSKQALYEAVLQRGMQPIFALLEEAAKIEADAERAEGVLRGLVAHLAHAPNLARLLQYETLSGGEHYGPLVARWIAPMYERGLAALKQIPGLGGWEPDEIPLVLIAYHHLLLGHFAMAHVLGEVLNEDLLSPQAVERQTRFLEKLTERLIGFPAVGGAARTSRQGDERE